jgi:hypothetical protein
MRRSKLKVRPDIAAYLPFMGRPHAGPVLALVDGAVEIYLRCMKFELKET